MDAGLLVVLQAAPDDEALRALIGANKLDVETIEASAVWLIWMT